MFCEYRRELFIIGVSVCVVFVSSINDKCLGNKFLKYLSCAFVCIIIHIIYVRWLATYTHSNIPCIETCYDVEKVAHM